MYYYEDTLHAELKAQGYVKKVLKPWNVKPNDLFILEDSTQPPYLGSIYIPVIITITDKYPSFYKYAPYNAPLQFARTAYRFDHKPLNPTDAKYLHNWHKTEGWNRFDSVEIWRKK